MGIRDWLGARGKPPAGADRLRQAAEAGDPTAQCDLGRRLAQVQGGQAEAIRWYRLAARQGHADAQFLLGSCYYAGRGVDRDQAKALRWYRSAAGQGHREAQAILRIWGA